MSKSKEKLQQFSSSSTTTSSTSSSSITKINDTASSGQEDNKKIIDNKKSREEDLSKMKRNSNDSGATTKHNNNNSNDYNVRAVDDHQHHHQSSDHHDVKKEKTIENIRNRKKLKDLNRVITCYLCDGYYIEATTINECLHSFCRSCIVQHLQQRTYCPKCKSFNKTISTNNLRPDIALRSLVYKLVPGLCQSEIQRLVKFNSNASLSASMVSSTGGVAIGATTVGNDMAHDLWDFYSPDEMISLSLEYHIHSVIGEQDDTSSISQIRYLKCPAAVTVHHLQRFISSKFNLKPSSKFSIEIIYEDEILPEDFSLMDVAYCYKWERLLPMQFFYRIFVRPERPIPKPVTKCKKVHSVSDQSAQIEDAVATQHVTSPTTTTTTIVSTNISNNNKNSFSSNDTSNSNKNSESNENSNVNNGDKNNNNNNDNDNNKIELKSAKLRETKKDTIVQEVPLKKDSNDSSNNKVSTNKSQVSVPPPQPPNDFKILRSNDIRYAITPSTVDRAVEISSSKKSNSDKRSKLSIKIERTQSHDDYNNNNNNSSSKQGDKNVASSPIKRRSSGSNSITLKRKYNRTDDEDDTASTKKSRSHHHHHHHQKYEIVQSPKVFDDDANMPEINVVPQIKVDLPNLKAKIKVPKLELSKSSSVGGGESGTHSLKSPSVTSSSSNSSSPRCSNDEVFVENQVKYAKTIGLQPSLSSADQMPPSHHHKHHNSEPTSSSHKKRKKSKHSKDSPSEDSVNSGNGSGSNGYSSNGNSKKRKIHAEISPQTEKSQDDLKLKFKINYKPAEKTRTSAIPTMIIDDDSSDKIIKPPVTPRIVMTIVPTSNIVSKAVETFVRTPAVVTSSNMSSPTITTATLAPPPFLLPKPSILPSMPSLISTNMTIPTPTISNSISQDVEEVIKRNKIKKSNIEIVPRMTPNQEQILNEMRAIHAATQSGPKPMVNIPHLSQVHLQSNDPIYGSKSPDGKSTNPMLVSIRNNNPMTLSSTSSTRNQTSSNIRSQMNVPVMPGRQQKQAIIKPPPFNFSPAAFANNSYANHPRTPYPILKSINLQRKSCYDIDPIEKMSNSKSAGPSIFDFPSETINDNFMKKDSKNQKRIQHTPPNLFEEPFSSIINSMTKTSMATEMRSKNLPSVGSTATTTTPTTPTTSLKQSPVKLEPPQFISSIGNSFISENQNSRTPIQPIQLPPASVSVTNVTNKAASIQLQGNQNLKNSTSDNKPVVEILRIQSTTPAVDQQIQPQKLSKTNRPPPPLIKRPQVMTVSNAANQRRASVTSVNEVKKIENINSSSVSPTSSPPKVERKSSSETKEPPQCDNIGALDLSGKSSRSPSLEKSPISKSSSRSNSTDDVSNDANESMANTTSTTTTSTTTTPTKASLSKQKKITDMFPACSWSIKLENGGSSNNLAGGERNAVPALGKSEITITTSTIPATPPPTSISSIAISTTTTPTSKPPPPKLTEISKHRAYTNNNNNNSKGIATTGSPTSAATITSMRQQNLSIRNVPNPSALAFRNQMGSNSNNGNTSTIRAAANNNNNNNNSSSTVHNGNNNINNSNNKTKVSEGKEIEKVIAHLKANAAADSGAKPATN